MPFVANHRAVLRSTNGGESFTDMTMDATDEVHPNGMHPDQHRLVTNPAEPDPVLRGFGRWDHPEHRSVRRQVGRLRLERARRAVSEPLPSAPVRDSVAAGEHEPRPGHAPVPEPLGEPVRPKRAPGRNPGQRDVGELRKRAHVAPDVLGRRRSVGLRRDRPALPLPHVLRSVTGRELLRRRDRGLELDRRPDLRVRQPVLHRRDQRPGRPPDDVRRRWDRDVWWEHGRPDEDARHGDYTIEVFREHCNENTGDFDPNFPCGDWVLSARPL